MFVGVGIRIRVAVALVRYLVLGYLNAEESGVEKEPMTPKAGF